MNFQRLRLTTVIAAASFILSVTSAPARGPIACGDYDGNGSVSTSDALRLLKRVVGIDVPMLCEICGVTTTTTLPGGYMCGDLDGDGRVVVTDVLRLLKKAVGQHVTLVCPPCASTTTSTTSTTLPGVQCVSDFDCTKFEFCEKKMSTCGLKVTGVCTQRPLTCDPIKDPVCGCNGQTYLNLCEAEQAGVNVDYIGVCAAPTTTTTSTTSTSTTTTTTTVPVVQCTIDSDCSKFEFCEKKLGTCGLKVAGVCTQRPLTCSPIKDPVCGCDGQTYLNACEAEQAGVNIGYLGSCRATTTTTSTTTTTVAICMDNTWCSTSQYCARSQGTCSTRAGSCQLRPLKCAPVFDQVCGCDGKTYFNSCEAHKAGVNVLKPGLCTKI